jgi:hypothetical protein
MVYLKYEFGEDDFEYEVSENKFNEAVKEHFMSEYKVGKNNAPALALIAYIVNNVDEEELKECVIDYFYNDAEEQYKDGKNYSKNPLGHFGMSERDFL